jgi:peptidoglycan/xylan/chitin deacetylase (PgdA/CDA1 family)
MDDSANATSSGTPAGRPTSGRLTVPTVRSNSPIHRRRRALALAVLVALGLIVLLIIALGGGSAHPAGVADASRPGLFAKIRTLAGNGNGSLVKFQADAETDAINRTLRYTSFVRVAGSQHREIALTFDDGPGPYTPQVLDVLERYHVPATFFEIGVLEKYFHASTSRIVRDGFPIGDHTFGHAPMSQLTRAEQRTQLTEQISTVGHYGASVPRLFRPPYGLFNSTTMSLLAQYRMLMILWTIDTSDWRTPGAQSIVQSAVSGARPGAIILMHDAGGNRYETVAALPTIIRQLRAKGYKLVTVPRLLLDNPAPHDQDFKAIPGSGG